MSLFTSTIVHLMQGLVRGARFIAGLVNLRFPRNRINRNFGLLINHKRVIITVCGIILFCVVSQTVFRSENVRKLKNVLLVKNNFTRKNASSEARVLIKNITSTNSATSLKIKNATTSATRSSSKINNSTRISTWATTQTSIATKRLFLTAGYAGRLGNRMFIYASLVGMALAQDREPFTSSDEYLESLFQVTHIRDDIKPDNWTVVGERGYAKFNSKFMKLPQQNIRLYGMLQCWRYFQHAQEEIRREFTFTADIQIKVQTTLATYRNRRENHVLVGVHVRRGDFLTPRHVKGGYGVANASYFVNAFDKIRSLLTNQNITFLIGSDDLDWCRNNINDSDIEILPQGSPADHFAILSSCDHAIITGGTFGWWIGWLANGVTIYYKNFITKDSPLQRGFTDQDYYPLGWIGLEN